LTLTAASNVVFVEQGWAPAHEDQAADRAHRIGQTKAVTAYKLIATDTIEEDIFEIVERKRPIVSGATDGSVDEQEASVLGELIERIAARAAA
jgi:SNF2 family DNA or RNA helicase